MPMCDGLSLSSSEHLTQKMRIGQAESPGDAAVLLYRSGLVCDGSGNCKLGAHLPFQHTLAPVSSLSSGSWSCTFWLQLEGVL